MPSSTIPAPKKRIPKKKSSPWDVNHAEIDNRLNAIYKNKNGTLPDMKKIEIKKSSILVKSLFAVLFIGVILSVGAWVNFFLAPAAKNNLDTLTSISFTGPAKSSFGKIESYTVQIKNTSSQNLKNSSINLYFPTNFVFVSSTVSTKNAGHTEFTLGTLSSFEQRTIVFTGRLYGTEDQKNLWRASLHFQPENIKSPLSNTATFQNTLIDSPFKLLLTFPAKIIPQQETQYVLTLIPQQIGEAQNLELYPILPNSFQITSSSPALTSLDRWSFKINPTSTKPIIYSVKGIYKNQTDDTAVSAQLFSTPSSTIANRYKIAEVSNKDTATPPPTNLTSSSTSSGTLLNLTINNSESAAVLNLGDVLNVNVTIKNTLSTSLKDAVLKLNIDSPSVNKQSILNWKMLTDAYDGDVRGEQKTSSLRRGQIAWSKNNISNLSEVKPGDEITVKITLPVKNSSLFNISGLSENTIFIASELTFTNSQGKIETKSLPQSSISLNYQQ